MRIESALTYVENQLAIFQAALITLATLAPVAPTPLIVYPTLPINILVFATALVSVALDFAHAAAFNPIPALVTTFLKTYKVLSEPSSRSHGVIKILDSFIFYDKPGMDEILYKNWLLKMKTKLQVNNILMLTKFYKISYIENCLANNALTQMSLRFNNKSTKPFIMIKEMFDVLTAGFNNSNKLEKAKTLYQPLHQGITEFSLF